MVSNYRERVSQSEIHNSPRVALFGFGSDSRAVLVRLLTVAWLLAASAAGDGVRSQSLRVVRTVEPRFPAALLQQRIYEGEVRIVLLVDAEGRLADSLLTGYTHPLFAREAMEALGQWRFEPARRGGEPIDVRTQMLIVFRASGMVVSLLPVDFSAQFLRHDSGGAIERVCRPGELDAPVTAVRTVPPLWPADWKTPMNEGRVTLDFYIDDEGRPRMPAVTQTDHEALNLPAIEALSQWRFLPPTRNGAPVLVRATQVFRFQRKT
jgi:TonB family protein